MAEQVVALSAWLDPHLLYRLLRTLPASEEVTQALVKVLAATLLARELDQLPKALLDSIPWRDSIDQTNSQISAFQTDRSSAALDKPSHRLLAKLLYETGDYSQSFTVLNELSKLGETDLWGLVHSAVAANRLDEGMKLISELSNSQLTLEQRIWLVHISLFVAFPEKPGFVVEIAGIEIGAVAAVCPHLIRYLVAAYVLTRDHKGLITFLAAIKGQPHSDPLLTLTLQTIESFEFHLAMSELPAALALIRSDFFLSAVEEPLSTNIQRFIIETYLRIHASLSMEELSSYLHLPVDQTELWAANLIRNAHMDAIIDSNRIKIQRTSQSLYTGVIEKTKEACFRSKVLLSSVKTG